MKLRLVKLTEEHRGHLTEMMEEWRAAGERIVPEAMAGDDYRDFERHREGLERKEPDGGHAPASIFFCLDEESDSFVGAVDIGNDLNGGEPLDGGHMEVGVRPSRRRQGIAAKMIGLALEECRKLGIGRVFLCCPGDDEGAARSIQKNGGVLENEIVNEGARVQRYRIDLKLLFVSDEKNYTEDMPVLEKYSSRAIILRDGKLAMQLGGDGEYKIPGGGAEEGESHVEALCREVAEETGLVVDPETVRFLGEAVELRRDIHEADKKYIRHSLVYRCDVKEDMVEVHMTDSEIERGYRPVWADPDTVIRQNHAVITEEWRKRDTRILEILRERGDLN